MLQGLGQDKTLCPNDLLNILKYVLILLRLFWFGWVFKICVESLELIFPGRNTAVLKMCNMV